MNVSRFRHDRDASPTVRATSSAARVAITDRTPPGSTGTPARSRALPGQLEGLPQIVHRQNRFSEVGLPLSMQNQNYVIESKKPGESFTTFTWPACHPDAMPMDLAHTRLDVRNLRSLETQAHLVENMQTNWGGRPVLHAFEQTAAALGRNLDGKDMHGRAMQTFVNCKSQAESLRTRYVAFAADASQLLANRTGSGASATLAASAPLTRIAESIWPTLRFDSAAEQSAWVERTLRNPEPFIAQSYDALSMAFGRVSVGISHAKNAVRETGRDKSPEERASIMQSMRATDVAFVATEEAFDRIDIPIDPAILKGHSVLAAYSVPPL